MERTTTAFEHFNAIECVNNGLQEDCVIDTQPEQQHKQLLITESLDAIDTLMQIEHAVKRILSSNEPGFTIWRSIQGRLQMSATSVGRLMNQLNQMPRLTQLQELLPRKMVSPFVQLLLTELEKVEWRGIPPVYVMPDGRLCAEHFNDLLSRIRHIASSTAFRTKANVWLGMASKNYQGTVKYIDSLFERHSKLLVIRLDLTYARDYQGRYDAALCKQHVDQFLNNRRNKRTLFKNLVGYIWRIEFGIEMGFHCHWVLIFNGNKSQQDIVLADAIGDYWRNSITQGYGTYWNCNKHGGKFKQQDKLGVGMIHNSDTHMRQNLLKHVISYLTKVDEFIRLQVPDDMPNFRTFGRGTMLKYRAVKKLGRPRTKMLSKPKVS